MAEQNQQPMIDLSVEARKYEEKLAAAEAEERDFANKARDAHERACGLRGAIAAIRALIVTVTKANAPKPMDGAAPTPEPSVPVPGEPGKIIPGPGSEPEKKS